MCNARKEIRKIYRKTECYRFTAAASCYDVADVRWMRENRPDVFDAMVACVEEYVTEETYNGGAPNVCSHDSLQDAITYLDGLGSAKRFLDITELVCNKYWLNKVYTVTY